MDTKQMLSELFDDGETERGEESDGGGFMYVYAKIRATDETLLASPLKEKLYIASWEVETDGEITSGDYAGPSKTKGIACIVLNLCALNVFDRDVAQEFIAESIGEEGLN